MISSAGSLRKSRARICLHTARSSGQIWMFESARAKSAESMSRSIRPNCASLANSQITMAEIPHWSFASTSRSLTVSCPLRAWIRMWVSRFSIGTRGSRVPPHAGGQQIALDLQFPLHASNQRGAAGAYRNHLGHGLASFRDHDALRAEVIQQAQTLFLEFRSIDLLHRLQHSSW